MGVEAFIIASRDAEGLKSEYFLIDIRIVSSL